MIIKKIKSTFLVMAIVSVFGCATHIAKPSSAVEPTSVKLATYQQVYMKSVSISEKFSTHDANQRALNKIDELMYADLKIVFPDIQKLSSQEVVEKSPQKTLIIEPHIKEIKFINGAARFWVGAMAGSSAVLLQAKFSDATTGEVLADPEFYRKASAMSGAWSFGGADNRMLSEIAKDVADYAAANK